MSLGDMIDLLETEGIRESAYAWVDAGAHSSLAAARAPDLGQAITRRPISHETPGKRDDPENQYRSRAELLRVRDGFKPPFNGTGWVMLGVAASFLQTRKNWFFGWLADGEDPFFHLTEPTTTTREGGSRCLAIHLKSSVRYGAWGGSEFVQCVKVFLNNTFRQDYDSVIRGILAAVLKPHGAYWSRMNAYLVRILLPEIAEMLPMDTS
ncbi:uncharacterized protein BO97DRAFT_429490 [Aspergillus homomorphus CBS 101889]|uniref:Uncharacterized protein n=1 Tax=Aspergillus homomorphus (strain CBS 101889) TaxID=1450537 RepID=A0A395HHB5_ASPHC|nr:hypothetical protein BO97DRAFT_429490 [Aspergillus homomorphus CBS 101889]RAL07281.1 hypothetical protein BO97DRAFT_429490 [Aspergillus homomorphus CBS 101889]